VPQAPPRRSDGFLPRGLSTHLRQSKTAGAPIACIVVLLTWRCPAACDHCVFESSPQRRETLDPEQARRLLIAAARLSPRPSLSFSGGEPFLHLELMRELIALGRRNEMPSEVVTSAAWVADRSRAGAILDDLAERGLGTLVVSYDSFHEAYVAPWKAKAAIELAVERGLRVVINSAPDPNDCETVVEYLQRVLTLDMATIRSCVVNTQRVVPVGRAIERVDRYWYPSEPPRGGCRFAGRTVTISPQGLLYPCCGAVIGVPSERADLFTFGQLGELDEDQLVELLESVRDDLFFQLLGQMGPYELLQALKRRDPSIITRETFTGECDACLEFTKNDAVRRATADLLARARSEVAVKLG
jgi:hypothetical protein